MKKIFLSLLITWPFLSWAQQNSTFTIHGELKNSPVGGSYIYLAYTTDGKSQLDSAAITGGKYLFKGDITSPGPARLFSVSPRFMAARSKKNSAEIFLEAVSFELMHVDSFSHVVVSGSTANADYDTLKQQMAPFMAKGEVLSAAFRQANANGDSAKAIQLQQQLEELDSSLKKDVLTKYLTLNPASPIALFVLENTVGSNMDPNTAGPLFDHLSAANKASIQGQAFQKSLDIARQTSIGHMAPRFTQDDTSGHPVSLSSFLGNYVLVDFWASWCRPCRAENPNVVIAYGKYHPKGFQIIGVSLDRDTYKDKWLKAIHDDSLTWTQVSDLQFWNNAVAKIYGVQSIPQNFLIDPAGKIVGKNLRGEELNKKLSEIFKD